MMELKILIVIYILLHLLFLKYVQCQCDGTGTLLLTATSSPQYFTSPNYPSNYPAHSNCSWRVQSPSEYDKIIINIEDYDSESVTSDYMDLYDGYNSSATLVVRMAVTNRKTVNAFVSSGDFLYFTFVSDYTIQYSGFQILYFTNDTSKQSACGVELSVTSSEQVLMSPNLPDVYNEFHTCSWTFTSTTGILFQIKFLDMGSCGQNHLRFYDGNSTNDNQLETECSTAQTYEFTDVETTGFTGHVAWTATNQSSDYYGFMLVYRTNVVTTTTTTVATTTLAPGVLSNCTASGAYFTAAVSPNFDYLDSPAGDNGNYPSNTVCRWYISAPNDYSVEAYFDDETTYAIESNSYCYYDYVVIYDGNSTRDTMLNKFCGSDRPTSTYRGSGTQMLIIFSSDYSLEYAGFRIRIRAVSNTYPGCKADYTEYSVMYNREATYILNSDTYINDISSPNFGISNYPTNVEVYWLFTSYNTTHYKMVLELVSINIERSYGCIYDRLVLYDGPCISDGVQDTVCGYWSKRWDLEGPEYLLHFHSDGYLTRHGFQLEYYAEEKAVTPPPTTTTTTFGPPVEAVVEAVKEMLTNYSTEDFPVRNLSTAITASIDFYLVGINGLDEVEQQHLPTFTRSASTGWMRVEQKMTSTGQFEVTWQDSNLVWDPTKRQRIVQILLPQNDLWKPDIALLNGFTSITAMGAKFMFINVDYNGSCLWRPYQIMESVCKVDMTHYPYDRQTCVLKFGTWSTDNSEVVTELGSLGLQIHPNFQENAEWRLVATETKQEDNNNHKVVEFFLTLERNHRYVTFYMTMPIVVLAYMNVFTFVIPSGSGEKTGFSITIFLSFVVLLIINNDSMPENSDTISLYSAFVLAMTILSAVALIVSVIQIRALTFTERRYPISNRVKNMMKLIKLAQSALTGKKKKTKKKNDDCNGGDMPEEIKPRDSGFEGSAIGSAVTVKVKKVSFMDDKVKDIEDENSRLTFPVQREPSRTTFMFDRENTLFEANTVIRSATVLSAAEKMSKETKPGGTVSISKNVNFADEGRQPERYNNIGEDKDPYIGNLTDAVDTDETITRSNSVVGQASTDLYHVSPLNENITPVTLVAVSPAPEANKLGDFSDKRIHEINEETLVGASNQSVPLERNVQVTGIFQSGIHKPNDVFVAAIQDNTNIKHEPALESAKLLRIGSDVNQLASRDNNEPYSISDGVESSMKQDASHQYGSVTDDVIQNQPTTATDIKMNRPSSTATNRSLSVKTKFTYSENRQVLADYGRAVVKDSTLPQNSQRPFSTFSQRSHSFVTQRPVSDFSQRSLSFVKQRPASSFTCKREESTVFHFGTEEKDNTSDEETDMKSNKSEDPFTESSESSCSSASEENNLSWPDLVSCSDIVFFIIYLLLITIMTLAMFLTMINAY